MAWKPATYLQGRKHIASQHLCSLLPWTKAATYCPPLKFEHFHMHFQPIQSGWNTCPESFYPTVHIFFQILDIGYFRVLQYCKSRTGNYLKIWGTRWFEDEFPCQTGLLEIVCWKLTLQDPLLHWTIEERVCSTPRIDPDRTWTKIEPEHWIRGVND